MKEDWRQWIARVGHRTHIAVAGLGERPRPGKRPGEGAEQVHEPAAREERARRARIDREHQHAVGRQRASDAPEGLDAEAAARNVLDRGASVGAVERTRRIVEVGRALGPEGDCESLALRVPPRGLEHRGRDKESGSRKERQVTEGNSAHLDNEAEKPHPDWDGEAEKGNHGGDGPAEVGPHVGSDLAELRGDLRLGGFLAHDSRVT